MNVLGDCSKGSCLLQHQSTRVPQLITLAHYDKLRARARAREPKLRHAQVLQVKEFVKKWSKNWCCKILLRITTVTY